MPSVEDGCSGNADPRTCRADHCADSVLLNQTAGRVHHVFLTRTAVIHDDFDGTAKYSACIIDFLDGYLDGLNLSHAVSRKVSCYRSYLPDDDGLGCKSRSAEYSNTHKRKNYSLHE